MRFYTYVFRGTPLYVQLLLLYTGMYSLEFVRTHSLLDAFFRSGFNCAILAFALNTCAYTTEIFAGAIRAIPHGEVEAARAYGMGWFTMYRRVILPSALRRSLPLYSNEVILMLHATTVAFTATVPDILKVARDAEFGDVPVVRIVRDRRADVPGDLVRARRGVQAGGKALAGLSRRRPPLMYG